MSCTCHNVSGSMPCVTGGRGWRAVVCYVPPTELVCFWLLLMENYSAQCAPHLAQCVLLHGVGNALLCVVYYRLNWFASGLCWWRTIWHSVLHPFIRVTYLPPYLHGLTTTRAPRHYTNISKQIRENLRLCPASMVLVMHCRLMCILTELVGVWHVLWTLLAH